MRISLRIILPAFLSFCLLACSSQKKSLGTYGKLAPKQVAGTPYLNSFVQPKDSLKLSLPVKSLHAAIAAPLTRQKGKKLSDERRPGLPQLSLGRTANPGIVEGNKPVEDPTLPVNKNARTSLTLSLISMLCLLITIGFLPAILFVIGLPIISMLYGYKALDEIKKEPAKYRGASVARTGIGLSIFVLSLTVFISFVIYLAFFLFLL
jgi:hypothetical protein